MQIPFQVMQGSVMGVGKYRFDDSVEDRRRNWVSSSAAIDISMIVLPLNCPALANWLPFAVRLPLIGEPNFVLFEYRG